MLRVITIVVASTSRLAAIGAQASAVEPQPVPRSSTEQSERIVTGPSAASCLCDTTSKPQLTVWTSSTCIPCRQFWRDLDSDRAFRTAILSRFRLQWVDVDAHRTAAVERGIASVLTFDLGNRQITGYRGKQWLWQELTAVDPDASVSPTSTSESVPDPIAPAADDSIPPLSPLPRARRSEGSEQTPGVDTLPNSNASETTSATSRIQRPRNARQDLTGRPSLWSRVSDGIHRSVPLVLTGLEVAGILGGSAATGGLGTIALAALWGLWKRRRLGEQSRTNGPTLQPPAQPGGEEADSAWPRAPFPRRLDEARELLAIRQSEGRVATLDALRGMFLDDELSKLASSVNDIEAAVAGKLKAAIDTRVDEVAPLSTTID